MNDNEVIEKFINFYNRIFLYLNEEFYRRIPNINNENIIIDDSIDQLISYDKSNKKFVLSTKNINENYTNLKYNNIDIDIPIYDKYSLVLNKYYTNNEILAIIKLFCNSEDEYLESNFLYAIISSNINVISSSQIVYKDEYGRYIENRGAFLNNVVIEVLCRVFANKYHLFYIPQSIGNESIINIVYKFLINDKYKDIIYNEDIDVLYFKSSNADKIIIKKYEDDCFKEKYNINTDIDI